MPSRLSLCLAHGGPCIGRDLDQVEIGLLRQSQRVLHADDADLLAAGADEAHLGDADPFIDTGLADGCSSLLMVTITATKRALAAERERRPFMCPCEHGRTGAQAPATARIHLA